jgi:hypothetical protein
MRDGFGYVVGLVVLLVGLAVIVGVLAGRFASPPPCLAHR